MKSLTCYLTLIIMPLLGFGQAVVTPGIPYPVFDANYNYYFYKGNDILSVKLFERTVAIQRYDVTKLKMVKIKKYEDMPKDYNLEMVKELGGRYYLFYTLIDKKENMKQLFYQEIGFDNCEFVGTKKLLIAINERSIPYGKKNMAYEARNINFNFYFSADTSKMLLEYRLEPEVKRDAKSHDIISFNVFDNKLAPISKNDVTMPYTEKRMDNMDYSIDADGNSYILARVFDDNSTHEKKDGNANYHIELLKVAANSAKIEIIPIKLSDNKFINNLWLYESPSGYMICSGLYSNGDDLSATDGIMLFKVGKDGKLFDMATYEIPVEVLNQFVKASKQKKNKKKDEKGEAGFDDLELRKFIFNNDGSFLLIGEQHTVVEHTYSDGKGGSRTTITHYYNDMLITKIDPQGKLAWMNKLPKRQRANRGGTGFAYVEMNDSHYVIFQDTKENKNLSVKDVPETFEDGPDGILTAFKVNDSNGEWSRISILDCTNVNGMELFQFHKSRVLKVSPDEFVFEAYKKKKEDVLIKVKLK